MTASQFSFQQEGRQPPSFPNCGNPFKFLPGSIQAASSTFIYKNFATYDTCKKKSHEIGTWLPGMFSLYNVIIKTLRINSQSS